MLSSHVSRSAYTYFNNAALMIMMMAEVDEWNAIKHIKKILILIC